MDHEGRIAKVVDAVGGKNVDALLVTDLTNVRYLTGFSGTNAQVLVSATEATFFSDPRYRARATELVSGAEVVIYPDRLTDVLSDHLSGRRLGVEAHSMTLLGKSGLEDALEDVEIEPVSGVIEDLRRIKEPAELELIRKAVAIGDEVFSSVLEGVAPGSSEREVALGIEVGLRTTGAERVSFEPIVGSGPLSAHIHHTPSDRVFEKGDLVLLDFGCVVEGYCSDLTRTVVLGAATDDQRDLYSLVLEAQRRGIEFVAAGASGPDVDAAARSVIDGGGHGDDFGHGLGHGVGLDVHEAPRLHRASTDTLVAGDVVTVEPGVYVAGVGGVRIEDCVWVRDGGAVVLGGAPKDQLLEL
ncbi:MAG: M24 family metallopeptidase [Actinomycetota bacterium]